LFRETGNVLWQAIPLENAWAHMHICFWRYELQNTTTIPNKEGVSGPGNDTTLINYSEF